MGKNILIMAPHSDDEILGCGGIISKYVNLGSKVYVCIVTHGHKGAPELFSKEGTERVRNEALQAHEFLGVTKTFFLDFPVLHLASSPSYKISLEIKRIIEELKIDTLYVPHRGDIHEDHRVVFETSLVAARPIYNSTIKRIFAYETLSETEWAAPFGDENFLPTVYENISNYIENKKKAFGFFKTQQKEFPHPRSTKAIEALSNYRGSTIGVMNAEAFMLIREVK